MKPPPGNDELRHDGGGAGQPGEDGAGAPGNPAEPDAQAGDDAAAGLQRHGEATVIDYRQEWTPPSPRGL